MPKEDYLQKYLEKMSRALAAMAGLREKGYPEDALRLPDELFDELFQLSSPDLAQLSATDFMDRVNQTDYRKNYLESLAALTFETARLYEFRENADYARSFYLKSLHLYLFLNEKDKTFSFDREIRISELKKRIDS